jgi:hypothetical protein
VRSERIDFITSHTEFKSNDYGDVPKGMVKRLGIDSAEWERVHSFRLMRACVLTPYLMTYKSGSVSSIENNLESSILVAIKNLSIRTADLCDAVSFWNSQPAIMNICRECTVLRGLQAHRILSQ